MDGCRRRAGRVRQVIEDIGCRAATPPGTLVSMTDQMKTEWKFSWNRWIGVMYGPIPVGLIVAGIAYGAYLVAS